MNFNKINVLQIFKYYGRKSVLFNKIFRFKFIKLSSISHRNINAFLLWYSKWFYLLCASLVSHYIKLINAQRLSNSTITNNNNCVSSSFCNTFSFNEYDGASEEYINLLRLAVVFLNKFIYSFSSLYITNKKFKSLTTILKSPHTDKKARNQYYRFYFNRTLKYSLLLSDKFFKLFKKLFKQNPFYWFLFSHYKIK